MNDDTISYSLLFAGFRASKYQDFRKVPCNKYRPKQTQEVNRLFEIHDF